MKCCQFQNLSYSVKKVRRAAITNYYYTSIISIYFFAFLFKILSDIAQFALILIRYIEKTSSFYKINWKYWNSNFINNVFNISKICWINVKRQANNINSYFFALCWNVSRSVIIYSFTEVFVYFLTNIGNDLLLSFKNRHKIQRNIWLFH